MLLANECAFLGNAAKPGAVESPELVSRDGEW